MQPSYYSLFLLYTDKFNDDSILFDSKYASQLPFTPRTRTMDILNGNNGTASTANDGLIAELYSRLDAMEAEKNELKARLSRRNRHIKEKYARMDRFKKAEAVARSRSRSRSRSRNGNTNNRQQSDDEEDIDDEYF